MKMKQTWYFIQWLVAKCGWPDFFGVMFIVSLFPTIFVSDPRLTEIFQYVTIASLFLVLVTVLYLSIRFLWRGYKEEKSKMFEILNKEEK